MMPPPVVSTSSSSSASEGVLKKFLEETQLPFKPSSALAAGYVGKTWISIEEWELQRRSDQPFVTLSVSRFHGRSEMVMRIEGVPAESAPLCLYTMLQSTWAWATNLSPEGVKDDPLVNLDLGGVWPVWNRPSEGETPAGDAKHVVGIAVEREGSQEAPEAIQLQNLQKSVETLQQRVWDLEQRDYRPFKSSLPHPD